MGTHFCPACGVGRADYEAPGAHLERCPHCDSPAAPAPYATGGIVRPQRTGAPAPRWSPDGTNDRSVTSSHWVDGCRCYRTKQHGRDIVIRLGCPVHSSAPATARPPEVDTDPLHRARRRIALAGGGAFDGGRYEIPAEMIQLNLYDIGDVEHAYARTGLRTGDGAEIWMYRGHRP